MKKANIVFFVALLVSIQLFASTGYVFALTGYEVAQRVEKAGEGFEDSISSLTMTLINSNGGKSIRKMTMKILEGSAGSKSEGDRSIITFLSPADIKGTGLLTYENLDRDDDQWLYLPALKRIKRIASKNKSGSFMGSEFSYEDISSQALEKYTYGKAVTRDMVDGVSCYKFERYPKDKDSGYTRQIVWVHDTEYTVQKTEYYDRKKELLKTASFSGYRKIKGVWRTGRIHMMNHQNRKETILEWTVEELKTGLKKRDFTKRMLTR